MHSFGPSGQLDSKFEAACARGVGCPGHACFSTFRSACRGTHAVSVGLSSLVHGPHASALLNGRALELGLACHALHEGIWVKSDKELKQACQCWP